MAERSSLTEATLLAAEMLSKSREAFRAMMPIPYMKERMTPREFQREYGVSLTEFQSLEKILGSDNMKEVVNRFKTARRQF